MNKIDKLLLFITINHNNFRKVKSSLHIKIIMKTKVFLNSNSLRGTKLLSKRRVV